MIRRALNPGADPRDVLGPLRAGEPRMGVYFGGFADTGRPGGPEGYGRIRARRASIRQLGRDRRVGNGCWLVHPDAPAVQPWARISRSASFAPPKADFVNALSREIRKRARRIHGGHVRVCAGDPRCAPEGRLEEGRALTGLREALRAEAVDPSHQYSTVLGTIGFDANGDSLQQFVTFYRVDPTAARRQGRLGHREAAGLRACTLTKGAVAVLGREQFPVPLGDDLDGTVDHFEGGLVVDRVRGV